MIFNLIQCLERGALLYPYNLLFNNQCSYSIFNMRVFLQFGVPVYLLKLTIKNIR